MSQQYRENIKRVYGKRPTTADDTDDLLRFGDALSVLSGMIVGVNGLSTYASGTSLVFDATSVSGTPGPAGSTGPSGAPGPSGADGAPGPIIPFTLGVFTALDAITPSSNFATIGTLGVHNSIDFTDESPRSILFEDSMPAQYAEGDITVELYCGGAQSGTIAFNLFVERITPAIDISIDNFGTAVVISGVAPNANSLAIFSGTITSVETSGLLKNEPYRLRLTRDTSVTPNASGDARLIRLSLRDA